MRRMVDESKLATIDYVDQSVTGLITQDEAEDIVADYVVANPETTTGTLSGIKIGDTAYSVGGGGGAVVVTFTFTGEGISADMTPSQVIAAMYTSPVIGVMNIDGYQSPMGAAICDRTSKPAFIPIILSGILTYQIYVKNGQWEMQGA